MINDAIIFSLIWKGEDGDKEDERNTLKKQYLTTQEIENEKSH